MLGDGRLAHGRGLDQISGRAFAAQQQAHQAPPGGIGQGFEQKIALHE